MKREEKILAAAALGQDLAESGRRNQEELDYFFNSLKRIKKSERVEIILKEFGTGEEYNYELKQMPFLGNKSAREDEIVGWKTV